MKTTLQFLTHANNSKILENSGTLDKIRITYIHSLDDGTYQIAYVQISVPPSECVPVIRIRCNFRLLSNMF